MNVPASITNMDARKALRDLALQIPELRRAAVDGYGVERAVVEHVVKLLCEEIETAIPSYCGWHVIFHADTDFKALSWEQRRAPYTATLETRDEIVRALALGAILTRTSVDLSAVFDVEVSDIVRFTNKKDDFVFTGLVVHIELKHPIAGLDLDASILVSLERPQ